MQVFRIYYGIRPFGIRHSGNNSIIVIEFTYCVAAECAIATGAL